MALLGAAELRRIERKYERGIGCAAVVEIFKAKGERFSAATLRKYVQLGLLPKSRRVGTRGRHRGSSGLYPVVVVGLVNEIKRALESGATLDEIRLGSVGLAGEVQALQRVSDQVMQRLIEAIKHQPQKGRRTMFKRTLDKHRRALYREVRALDRFAGRLGIPQIHDEGEL